MKAKGSIQEKQTNKANKARKTKTSKKTRYSAVIVAAGMSTRMKRFKQLMKIGGMSFAERVVVNFLEAGISEIVMVTGFRSEQLEQQLKDFPVTFVNNPDFENTQMLDSVKIGLRAVEGKADRVFFCPVDVPFFTVDTVKIEMEAEGDIIVPVCDGKDGHPLLVDAKLIPEILAYEGGGGLRGAYESLSGKSAKHADEGKSGQSDVTVTRIEVPDEGAVTDADTKADFEKLVELHNKRIMHTEAQVTFVSTSAFFGPETLRLLEEIDKCGSVRRACEECGISYSKGWKLLGGCETRLGFQVAERTTGGKNGGSAQLTEKGRILTEAYKEINKEVSALSDDVFRRVMKKYELL